MRIALWAAGLLAVVAGLTTLTIAILCIQEAGTASGAMALKAFQEMKPIAGETPEEIQTRITWEPAVAALRAQHAMEVVGYQYLAASCALTFGGLALCFWAWGLGRTRTSGGGGVA